MSLSPDLSNYVLQGLPRDVVTRLKLSLFLQNSKLLYLEPVKASPSFSSRFSNIHFNIIIPSMSRLPDDSVFEVFYPKFCIHVPLIQLQTPVL
jgi:hypothetical protein